MLLLSGVNPKVVADRLGHASVTITLDTYSHVLPHIQADATDTISKIMRG
jgi:integrase